MKVKVELEQEQWSWVNDSSHCMAGKRIRKNATIEVRVSVP